MKNPDILRHFVGSNQRRALSECVRGEEGPAFVRMLDDLNTHLHTMPTTYDQDGKGDEAIVHLHYFSAHSDWWITEKDAGSPDDAIPGAQEQAFGFACLNGMVDCAEIGYISIAELIRLNVELDLYWTPKTLGQIKAKLNA